MAITALVDANGVAINVGDTVYIAGTVIATNPANQHFREVSMTLNHNLTGSPTYLPRNEVGIDATAANNTLKVIHTIDGHHPGADYVIKCSGLILNH